MMTNAVSRSLVLLAKYMGAMTCLIIPLLISLTLALILFTVSGVINLSAGDWLRIGGIVLTSIVYLSAFYLIVAFVESHLRRLATRLYKRSHVSCSFLVLTSTGQVHLPDCDLQHGMRRSADYLVSIAIHIHCLLALRLTKLSISSTSDSRA